jgi:exodeoxyribonuclease-1
MAASFFFYDVETSGLNPRAARIMQFAGQRTDMDLQPIGDPINTLIKLPPDVLPDPEAILVTGITPQMTLSEGLTEAAFLKLFYDQAVKPDTIFLGYNSIRFDDEFMRFLHYRNFYDAYSWQSQKGCSRWDMLDAVRMTRALRPKGIAWPFDSSGKPSNRLPLLSGINKLAHQSAHDALSDVNATIALSQLIRRKQPKLFDFLLKMRLKTEVSKLVLSPTPFVYSSGEYPSEFEKTTAAVAVGQPSQKRSVLVYNLRFDPSEFSDLSTSELMKRWQKRHDDESWKPFPVTTLQFNRCPAIAPLSVMDDASQKRLQLDMKVIENHFQTLQKSESLITKLQEVQEMLNKQKQIEWTSDDLSVDEQLYDGFFDDRDKNLMTDIHDASPETLSNFITQLNDPRLKALLPLYKARNYPADLSSQERSDWEAFCQQRLMSGKTQSRLARYMQRITELATKPTTDKDQYLLEELRLYGESIMPV